MDLSNANLHRHAYQTAVAPPEGRSTIALRSRSPARQTRALGARTRAEAASPAAATYSRGDVMRVVKHRSTESRQPDSSKLPSRCADSELRHLEIVIRRLLNMEESFVPPYLNESYWLKRLDRLEREICLIPTQQRRLVALRKLLGEEAKHNRQRYA